MSGRYSRAFLLAWLALRAAAGHDIPAGVTAHVFLKPEAGRMRIVARIPLRAVRDIEFPERDGYLDLEKLQPLLGGAATVFVARYLDIREEGVKLAEPRVIATRIALPSDRSFDSFESALAGVTGPPLGGNGKLVWNQVLFDVALETPVRSAAAAFAVRPGLEHLGEQVTTALRFVTPEGAVRAFEFHEDPGLVPLDPTWLQAAGRFVSAGFRHILDGADHLLFLLCLVLPARRPLALLGVVTAFTAAHSITLAGSAMGMAPGALWFPPVVEALIAASIVYMAIENIVAPENTRRWRMAFAFGLVHGFGFSFALRETLQFAGSHLAVSLAAFNLGVELGQIAALAAMLPGLWLLFRYVSGRTATIVVSVLVAHTGWHWFTDRAGVAGQFRFEWPAADAAALAAGMRVMAAAMLVAGAVWLVRRVRRG
jgi:hypothetical protein